MIILKYSKDLSSDEFTSESLKELNEVVEAEEWINQHYFMLYYQKADKIIATPKGHENTIFSIRKPGCSLAYITVDSDFKIIDAKYYQDKYNQKVFSLEKLVKMDEIMQGWIGQQVEVQYGDFTARNDDDLETVRTPKEKRTYEQLIKIRKNMLIGKVYEDIKESLKKHDYRVVRMDKNHSVITDDLVMTRMNISIDNGIITDMHMG